MITALTDFVEFQRIHHLTSESAISDVLPSARGDSSVSSRDSACCHREDARSEHPARVEHADAAWRELPGWRCLPHSPWGSAGVVLDGSVTLARMYVVVRVAIETAVILGAAVPLVAIGMWSSRVRAWRPLLVFAALFVLDDLVLRLPKIGPFTGLAWNWQGMVLEVGWGLALAATPPAL